MGKARFWSKWKSVFFILVEKEKVQFYLKYVFTIVVIGVCIDLAYVFQVIQYKLFLMGDFKISNLPTSQCIQCVIDTCIIDTTYACNIAKTETKY